MDTPRKSSRTKKLVAGAAIVGAMLGSAGIAVAQTADSGSSSTAPSAQSAPDPTKATHPGEELLTGETATKVAEAAKAELPDATLDRVETDAEGSPYEAHMTKADGSHVTVKVDSDFKVTGVETGGPGGPGHHGPPPQGQAPQGQSQQSGNASSTNA